MKKKCQIFSFWARPDLGTSRRALKTFWGALKQGKILDNADSFSASNKHVSSLVPKKLQMRKVQTLMRAPYKLQSQS